MPLLPGIKANTLRAIPNTSYTLKEYFNPAINASYSTPIHDLYTVKALKYDALIALAKDLMVPGTFEELLPYLCMYWSGGYGEGSIQSTMKRIFYALPEDKRWLMMFSAISDFRERSANTKSCSWYVFFPSSVNYNETVRDHKRFIVNTSYVSSDSTISHFSPNDEQLAAAMAAADLTPALNKFNEHLESTINIYDCIIPSVIRMLVSYAWNMQIFYPTNDITQFGLRQEFITPKIANSIIDMGCKLSFEFRPHMDRIHIAVKPAAGDRRSVARVLSYSANVLDYIPYSIKGATEGSTPLYGVELETSSDYTPQQLIDAQKDLFFILKQDSSIRGSKTAAYELVTVPCSLKSHKRLWAEFFEKVDYQNFDTSRATGNGMHVHIGRDTFSKPHLNRFTWFMTNPANEDFIFNISERPTKTNLLEWAKFPNHMQHSSRIYAAKLALKTNSGIRGAVHFKGTKTVEVRIFKGIVSYATIVKNLEFVDSVVEYTRVTPLCQMHLRNYLDWLNATNKNKYQMIKAFLKEIKLDPIIISADLTETLWKSTKENEILKAFKKSRVPITKDHINLLNKRLRKRTFAIDKNGVITCLAPIGGLLSKFDKDIQHKQMRGSTTLAMNEFNS